MRTFSLTTLLTLVALPGLCLAATGSASNPSGLADVFEDKPRWEFGLGAGVVNGPAYPSSGEAMQNQLLLPYFVYRGRRLRMQDGGVKAIAVENRRWSVDLGIGGSLAADSSETPLREGMPDLDYLFEIGPRIDVRLIDTVEPDGARHRLGFSTQLRAVFATDFSGINASGVVLGMQLGYRRDGWLHPNWSVLATVGPVWASEDTMDYFYQVDSQFVTPTRPAFDARAGYLGTNAALGLVYRIRPDFRMVVGLGMNFHGGTPNEESPLFEAKTTHSLGLGLLWQIKRSADSVRVIDR